MPRARADDPHTLPRSYSLKLAPETNPGKLAKLRTMQVEWQRTLGPAFDWYWQPFLKGGAFPFKPARSGPESTFPATRLVTSQKDLMVVAIEGQARSWASNLKNRVTRALMRCPVLALEPKLRRELLWLNSMHAWLMPYPRQLALLADAPKKTDRLEALSPLASRWMRRLVRSYLSRKRLPDPLQIPMQVNQLSSTLAPAQSTRSPWAADWLRVSTLERGQRINLPLMDNPHARSRGGRLATTFSLYEKGGAWYARSTRYLAPTPWPEHRVEVLAIDLGLRNLMATSEGDLRGTGFLDQLLRYDAQLMRIQKGLQGAGELRLAQCRRYRLLVDRLRGWLKTTVQTHLNAVLARHQPVTVVIEDLAFAGRHGELSRRMNRLLRRFGQQVFKQTLAERQAEYGFKLEEVNPAYSSQTCASCGFVHRTNRKGDRFTCKACGHRAHADVNAAVNLARRSRQGSQEPSTATFQQELASVYQGHRAVLARALQLWAARMSDSLRTTPGQHRHMRAAGCARVGLRLLQRAATPRTRKRPASRGVKEDIASLLNGLRALSSPGSPGELSTR